MNIRNEIKAQIVRAGYTMQEVVDIKNYVYEPIDLCACYEPMVFPPDDFWDEPQNPFCGTIERKIGNTWYIIKTECGGNEALTDKVKRLIFSEKGEVS